MIKKQQMFRFKVYRYDPALYKHVDREDRSIIYTGKKTRFDDCILIYVINRIGRLYNISKILSGQIRPLACSD